MLTPPGWSHTLLMLALMLDSADAMPVRLGEPRLRAGDVPLLRGERLRLERPPEFTAGWKLSSLEPVWPWRRSRCVVRLVSFDSFSTEDRPRRAGGELTRFERVRRDGDPSCGESCGFAARIKKFP